MAEPVIRILVGGPEAERTPVPVREQAAFYGLVRDQTTSGGRRMIERWASPDRMQDVAADARLDETFVLMWRTTIDGKTGQNHG